MPGSAGAKEVEHLFENRRGGMGGTTLAGGVLAAGMGSLARECVTPLKVFTTQTKAPLWLTRGVSKRFILL